MDLIYRTLYNIGYTHPLHPTLTHLPIGLVLGALVLVILGLALRRENMALTAKYCIVIALISLFPTMLLGFLDWQHYFAGGWLNAIKVKITLGTLLLIILAISLVLFRKRPLSPMAVIAYGLSFLITIVLGYFGGQLVYTGRVPPAPPGLEKGAYVFRANCSGCHPYGGNIVDRDAVIERSPELKDAATFSRFIRDPRLDNGRRGPMPPFTLSRIPENEARELFAYLSVVMGDVKQNDNEAQLPAEKIAVRTGPQNIQNGEKLFKEYCSSCHAISGTETIIGPGLKGILKRQSLPVSGRPAVPENIYRQLKAPYKEMPSFSNKVSYDQMLDIIAYLNTL